MVTRAAGYRRGVPREEAGLSAAEGFFEALCGMMPARIVSADENYEAGDFRAASGLTIECKRQPIDPRRYPLNFVEVFETTNSPRHRAGFEQLARLLDCPVDELAAVTYEDRRRRARRVVVLGHPPFVSVSIRSIASSAFTVYVNPDDGYLYLYTSEELMKHVRSAVLANGLRRGMGNSNEDTFAVQVPIATMRWSRTGAAWRFEGSCDEGDAVATVREACGA